MTDVTALLEELRALVAGARPARAAGSCVVNRSEVLLLVDQICEGLPHALLRARDVLADRAAVVEDGRREAAGLVADSAVLQAAQQEAARLRAEVEHYVDGRLATFEIVLTRTLQAVERGRAQLGGAHEMDALAEDELDRDAAARLLSERDDEVPLLR